jgi:hypothetical protein
VVVTGATHGPQVVHVAGVASKWQAIRNLEFNTMVLPQEDLDQLPTAARRDANLSLLGVQTIEDAVVDLMGPGLGLQARRLAAAIRASGSAGPRVNVRLWLRPADWLANDEDVPSSRPRERVERIPRAEERMVGGRSWHLDDWVECVAVPDRDCHLTLIGINSTGAATVLSAAPHGTETFAKAGEEFVCRTRMAGPPGRHRLIAVASAAPLPVHTEDVAGIGGGGGGTPATTRAVNALAGRLGEQLLGWVEVDSHITERPQQKAIGVHWGAADEEPPMRWFDIG